METENQGSENPTKAGPSRILIVDDELSVREFVSRVLNNAGYETALALDGPGAPASRPELGPIRHVAHRYHDAAHERR